MESLILQINTFNFQCIKFEKHYSQKTEMFDHVLNQQLAVINQHKEITNLLPDSYEVTNFFINIHKILCEVDPNTNLMDSTLQLIRTIIENEYTRKYLIEKLRFLPSLCQTFNNFRKIPFNIDEKLQSLLKLIEDLTYGIVLNDAEPYLMDLIVNLYEYIKNESHCNGVSDRGGGGGGFDNGNENDSTIPTIPDTLGTLSLSILINICFKNVSIVYALVKFIHLPTFTKQINCYGILSKKMILLLSSINVGGAYDTNDVKNFFTSTFADVNRAIRTCNIQYLRHTVDFFMSTQSNYATEYVMEIFDFQIVIERLIAIIKELNLIANNDDNNHNNNKRTYICMSMVFEIINYIILSKNKSLENIYNEISGFCVEWMGKEITTAKSLDTVRLIIDTTRTINNVDQLQVELIKIIDGIKCGERRRRSLSVIIDSETIIALLKLLVVLNKYNIDIISNVIDYELFQIILNPITETIGDCYDTKFKNINNLDLLTYINCLYSLMCYDQDEIEFKRILQLKSIQYMIAVALQHIDKEITFLVLKLSRSKYFPITEISEIKSKLSQYVIQSDSMTSIGRHGHQQSEYPTSSSSSSSSSTATSIENQFINIHQFNKSSNKTLEDRLTSLINHVSIAIENKKFNSTTASALIEIYDYKISNYERCERQYIKQLNNATIDNTNATHRVLLLSEENRKYQNLIFAMHVNEEHLKTANEILENKTKNLHSTIGQLKTRSESFEAKCLKYEKNIELLNSEISALKQNLDISKIQIGKLEKDLKEIKKNRSEAVRSLELLSVEKQKYLTEITNLQTENKSLTAATKNMNDDLMKKDRLIQHLENSVKDKTEKIDKLETELRELENIEQSVLALIQSKKSKKQ